MARTYPSINGGESSCFITTDGGVVSLTGDPPRVAGLERITTTPYGVGFGPLSVSTPDLPDDDHTVAAVENLRFAPTKDDLEHDEDESLLSPDDSNESDDGWLDSWWGDDEDETNTTTASAGVLGLSLGGAAAADADPDDVTVTRRQTIGVMASALALGGAATASAQEDTTQIKFAEFDLTRADGPVHVGVLPIVDNALPADTSLRLSVDGAQRHEWTPTSDDVAGETIVLPDDRPRTVKVYAEGGVGQIDKLLAWARGFLASGDELKATLELPRNPADMSEGETVVIDDHPAFVETVRKDNGEESIVTIGGESIPHEDEPFGHDRGVYRTKDSVLEYVAGSEPPDGQLVQLRLRAGRIASMTDATSRAI